MLDSNLVLRQMEGAGTKLNIVILDACRNNPFGGRSLRGTDSGLAQMRAPEDADFLCNPARQRGAGWRGRQQSLHQGAGADAAAARLDIFQTFNEVGLAVMQATGDSQQPWVSSSPIRGNFYFAGQAAGPAPSAAIAPSPARTSVLASHQGRQFANPVRRVSEEISVEHRAIDARVRLEE